MGVQLNIKDPDTVRLARELAGKTGRTVTETIRSALERAQEERDRAIVEKIKRANEIVAEFQKHMPEEWRGKTSREIMDAIYDDNEPDGFAR